MTHAAPQSLAEAKFCTEHSRAADEPLAGTGGHQGRYILIRWPKSQWHHSLRLAGSMDNTIAAAIERVVEAGWRVNLIDRKDDPSSLTRVFLFPDAVALDVSPEKLVSFLNALRDSGKIPNAIPSQKVTKALVLCCTHDKHDACCAKFGFAVYKALAEKAAQQDNFDVWEVTHLGGCRLSAGVLVLPALRKYGRLRPDDAKAFSAAESKGMPYLPCYRGAAHLDPPAQAAEVMGLRHLAGAGLRGTARISEIGPHVYAVRLPGGVARMRADPVELSAYGACSDLKVKAPLGSKTVWRAQLLSLSTE